MTVLAVSGGRGWTDREIVWLDLWTMRHMEDGPERLAVGDATRGLDPMAAELAEPAGFELLPPWEADWHPNGGPLDRTAGHKRNKRMLIESGARALLAYPDDGSRGTWNCVAEAMRLSLAVVVTLEAGHDYAETVRRCHAGVGQYLGVEARQRVRVVTRSAAERSLRGLQAGVGIEGPRERRAAMFFDRVRLPTTGDSLDTAAALQDQEPAAAQTSSFLLALLLLHT